MFHFKKPVRYFSAANIFLLALLMGGGVPQMAKAETILNWELGGAVSLGDSTINSPISGNRLDPESPTYFQTMVAAGYRFEIAPWFFISPLGYYRLTVGALEYRDINSPSNLDPSLNLFHQRQFIGNELAMGGDFGFVIGKWTIAPGFYFGARHNLTKSSSRYFIGRDIISEGDFQGAWQFVMTPRIAVDYRIASSIDMGAVVDYNFALDDATNALLNFSLRAGFHF